MILPDGRIGCQKSGQHSKTLRKKFLYPKILSDYEKVAASDSHKVFFELNAVKLTRTLGVL